MEAEVFLDTAYAIALSSPNDQFHARAVDLADQLEALETRLVTTAQFCWKSEMPSPNSDIVRLRCSCLTLWKLTPRWTFCLYRSHSMRVPCNCTVSALIKSGGSQTVSLSSSCGIAV